MIRGQLLIFIRVTVLAPQRDRRPRPLTYAHHHHQLPLIFHTLRSAQSRLRRAIIHLHPSIFSANHIETSCPPSLLPPRTESSTPPRSCSSSSSAIFQAYRCTDSSSVSAATDKLTSLPPPLSLTDYHNEHWITDGLVLRHIWGCTSLEAWSGHSIKIGILMVVLVSDGLVKAVTRADLWYHPVIAQKEGDEILGKIVEFPLQEDKKRNEARVQVPSTGNSRREALDHVDDHESE
ncbi:hypothetical protein CERZMDRAFT_89294 [Cercospora zeae-maydis SCOH1-5]|uniref:Uncharacterized protein n=1 Tax=Cercospora zeae-maydis SCOH1-5 TaxID=717836 RepID=A0A6A6EZD4_9PEZI|nr:hypothetical protein CERZMDRAFT_89294 [Cercospora zeae-maydis SCOH1-5]